MPKEIAFFLGVYKEQSAAQIRLKHLKSIFPDSPILCISDGVDDPGFAAFCYSHDIFYRVGDRLKTKGNGGAWTERFLRYFLEVTNPSVQTLFKIDPDTGIHRPFKFLPDPSVDLFGTMYGGDRPNICGGCMGFRRRAIELIVHSGQLPRTELSSYRRYGDRWLRQGEESEATEIVFQDEIVFQVAQSLHLKMENFADVYANIRSTRWCAEQRYALSHPYFYPEERNPGSLKADVPGKLL